MCVLYAGLPGTLKFTCEFYIFSTLVEMSWASCILLLFIINVFGLIGFSKVWFTIIFGLPNNQIKATILDLSRKEIYIILYIFFFFFLINYISLFNIL
jgi:NADH:ubiquinone oxidoreductase subunit 4 (subunit M)